MADDPPKGDPVKPASNSSPSAALVAAIVRTRRELSARSDPERQTTAEAERSYCEGSGIEPEHGGEAGGA